MSSKAHDRRDLGEELVTVCKPGGEKDVTYVSAAGPIRFLEGKARVPLSVARQLAAGRSGWTIEP